MKIINYKYPILSGLFGSLGGLFSKGISTSALSGIPFSIVIRLCCVGLMLLCNALGGFFFAKALNDLPSLTSTIISTIMNFIMSGLIGGLLGEHIPFQWFIGMGILIIGVILLIIDNDEKEQKKKQVSDLNK